MGHREFLPLCHKLAQITSAVGSATRERVRRIAASFKSSCGKLRVPTTKQFDWMGISRFLAKCVTLCREAWVGIFENLHLLPFCKHTLRRDFSLLDCAAGTQSRANQFGPRRDPKTCDFQSDNR